MTKKPGGIALNAGWVCRVAPVLTCPNDCGVLVLPADHRLLGPKGLMWWAHQDSNLGPLPCEGSALTN